MCKSYCTWRANVKAKLGIDIPKPMWSSYRAQIKAGEAKLTGEVPKKRGTAQPAALKSAVPAEFGQDVKDVMRLIKKYGPSAFKQLVDGFVEPM